MNETGKILDKGKERATSPIRTKDFVKLQSQEEKVTFNSQRDILKGGMDKGKGKASSSGQQDTSKQQDTSEVKSKLSKATEKKNDSYVRKIAKLEKAAGPETQEKTKQLAKDFEEWQPTKGQPLHKKK